jgi:hypothetical protein
VSGLRVGDLLGQGFELGCFTADFFGDVMKFGQLCLGL